MKRGFFKKSAKPKVKLTFLSTLAMLFLGLSLTQVAFSDMTAVCGDSSDSSASSTSSVKCCNPVIMTCPSGTQQFAQAIGFLSIGGNLTTTVNLQCSNDLSLASYSWAFSGAGQQSDGLGGLIDCTMAGGTLGQSPMITLSCHNSSTYGGTAWITGVHCSNSNSVV